jgi:hypothetical protein
MSDSKPQNDPSMDDILASIRKIISDDEARAATPPSHATPASGTPSSDDVLLLTDLIEEPPGAAEPAKPSSPSIKPIPSQPKATVMDIDAPQPVATSVAPPAKPPTASPAAPALGGMFTAPAAPLPAANTGSKVSASFERLNRSAIDTDPPPHTQAPASSGIGGKTIEDLVREMMRAALQEWMDKNLPEMVEKMVEREIARMSRR